MAQTIDFATNAPRSGDVLTKQQIKFFSDGETGSDVIWDFSGMSSTEERFRQEYLYDSDSVLVSIDPESMSRYNLTEDSLLLVSVESPLKRIVYDVPQVQALYPFNYGDSICHPFSGRGLYCKEQNIRHRGTLLIESDAQGTIIESEEITLENAVRLHTYRISSYCMSVPSDTLFSDSIYQKQEIEERYQWYVRGYRYPVYETISTTYYDNMEQVSNIRNAYHYLTEEQAELVDSVNRSILNEEETIEGGEMKDIFHYTAKYENNRLELKYDLDEDANLNGLICNKLGMLFVRKSEKVKAGTDYVATFDCSGLRPDDYILYINVNGKVYSEKFKVK